MDASTNPLLDKIKVPGETFRLPSGGIFYTNGELDESVTDGEVYVSPMTTYDEICLKTPDKLLNGTAVNEVFRRCIPSVLAPDQLFIGDVDFLLTCLRKITYGDDLEISWQHDCEGAKEHTYTLSLGKFISKTVSIDPSSVVSDYHITLENGQRVQFQPMQYKTMINIYQALSNENLSLVQTHESTIKALGDVIVQVDDITDKRLITEWLTRMNSNWVKQIQRKIESVSKWGPDFSVEVTCKDCGKNITTETPINPVAFFTEL